jgi:hypothetical protein|uniref:Uncharacterized protein n=1 Tax=Zea mays TaxID=4577 RepID=C4IY26_MAIZE|nr:unknown [Zea mays]
MTTATDQTKLTSNAGEPRASSKGKYVCIREGSQLVKRTHNYTFLLYMIEACYLIVLA